VSDNLLLQMRQQPYETSLQNMSGTDACPPVYPTTPAVTISGLSGRSPSLVAMERVMPKYASWASSDTNVARWQLVRDRNNTVDEYSPLVQTDCTTLASRCGRPAALSDHHLPTSAAVDGGTFGSMSSDLMTTANMSSSSAVTMSGAASARNAKEELRARLSHRPASSAALRHLCQVGKAGFMTYPSSLLGAPCESPRL